jgi:hemerythrin superfamily protein
MKSLSEQEKRLNLAGELADIEWRQRAIVQWNSRLRSLLPNMKDGRETLEKIAEEDEKNLRMLETVMTSFGVRVEPKAFTKGFTDLVSQRMADNSAPAVEKLGAYALVKQNQAMCSTLAHKIAQVCKLDVKEALGLFAGVETSMVKQVGQISELMEKASVILMTGEEPVGGVTGRLRDAAVSVAGAVINTVGKPADEMNVLNVLKMDHLKVRTLFKEIEKAVAPLDKNDLFYQLRLDLLSHSEAEEQCVYRYCQQFRDVKELFDESWSEHDEMRSILDVISNVEAGTQVFQDRIKDLQTIVQAHVDKEEDEIFKVIRSKVDDVELVRMAQDFISRKAHIQRALSPHIVSGAVSPSGPQVTPPAMM